MRLAQMAEGPTIAVIVLDPAGDSQALQATLASIVHARSTDQRVQLDSFTFDQNRFKGLDAQTVKSRCCGYRPVPARGPHGLSDCMAKRNATSRAITSKPPINAPMPFQPA